MATLHSFYLPPDLWRLPFRLEGAEAHHLSRVLRLKAGATVRLFDGRGRHGLFTVESASKAGVSREGQPEDFSLPPRAACTLSCGFSKALCRVLFLEKVVELEASALLVWDGDYSQVVLPGL